MSFYGVPLIRRQSDITPIANQKLSMESIELEVSKNSDKVSLDSNSEERPTATIVNSRSAPSSRNGSVSRNSIFSRKLSHGNLLGRRSFPSALPDFAIHQSSQAQPAYEESSTASTTPKIGDDVTPPNLSPKEPGNSTFDQDIGESREKTEEHETSEEHSETDEITIPEFVFLTDLSVFNTEEGIREAFLEPPPLLSRFEKLMNVIQEHDVNDPVNYAYPREKSLREYLRKRSVFMTSLWSETLSESFNDVKKIEDCITHELFKCRDIVRTLLNQQLESESGYRKVACEMLVQGNTINYVRYILTLPECSPSQEQNLNEFQKQAYEIKRALFSMGDALVTLDEQIPEDFTSKALIRDIFLAKSISNYHLEFNRLENYAIHIWMKFTSDFLIELRITQNLFKLHRFNMLMNNRESIKVLVFNQAFSANYSWYLAVTLPFTRVFEASLVNENVSYNLEDTDSSSTVESPSQIPASFSINDEDDALYQTYYSKLNLNDFDEFSQISGKQLVNLQRSLSPKTGTGNFIVKPANFEYYAHPLSTLSSETFQVVQCRDFVTQVPPKNRVSLLKEFHRILKVGGVLELPLFFSGSEADALSASFREKDPTLFKVKHANWEDSYTLTSSKEIFAQLCGLFGQENVKHSNLLLTSKSPSSGFLIKHTAMFFQESFTEVDQFDKLAQTAKELETLDKDNLCFYIYMSAEKGD